jgi:SOS-response transcriptional repressor LexA
VSKYLLAIKSLQETKKCKMTVFGHSMMPIIKNGSTLEFEKKDEYEVGDIVFCKVKGRFIDAHKVTKKNPQRGYLIANNHGWENGWTKNIYGKVVRII